MAALVQHPSARPTRSVHAADLRSVVDTLGPDRAQVQQVKMFFGVIIEVYVRMSRIILILSLYDLQES